MSDDDEIQHGKNNNASFTDQCESYDQTSGETPQSGNRVVTFIRKALCCNSCQSSQSGQDEAANENLHAKCNPILLGLAIAFSRRPLIVLLITISLAFAITWIGLSEYGLPEFDDPYLVCLQQIETITYLAMVLNTVAFTFCRDLKQDPLPFQIESLRLGT